MASDAAVVAQPAAPGTLIGGRYRVEASLGQGGMGAVYLVHDAREGRKVALKQLRAPPGEKQGLLFSQFEREYHTLTQLAHPRIIEVYDYGVEEGYAFYTMELLDGQDLRERGRLPWREVCAVLRDVASSLAVVHSRRLIHRDVSARNVRCTRDGRAKLIDFGAMAPMGVSKHVVGTPPFVPPEALQLQALDGRADLYALGSLAYWLLTGRYAYPARKLDQLRDLWRSPPASPKQYDPTVPEALDRLVMSLIQLDRGGRPGSAAEVMERFSGIAGLPLDELPEVSRAYLAMPMLVGREAPLREVRRLLVQSMHGHGDSLLIEGQEGVGRSRFLDAAVLDAKLLGSVVLRADAGDATGEYSVVRTLGRQLLRDAPQIAARGARPWRSLLSRVLPELERASQPPRTKPERRHLQSALCNWFLVAARKKHIVIAVDDIDAIDEQSAAMLAALAQATDQKKLSLLATCRHGEAGTAALALLRETARRIRLEPLSAEQTLSLLRSVFGDVAHINSLAERIHRLAHGHPRWTMSLCERLVERRAARYEAGSWSLPAELSSDDLPPSLSSLLSARVAGLSADARELAEALALTDESAVVAADYATITSHRNSARTHHALDELVTAAVLVPDGRAYRFTEGELAALLRTDLSPERKRELHGRIAGAIGGGDPALLPRHLLLGGREREGIEYLFSLRDDPRLTYSATILELLELAVEHAKALGMPMELQLDLQLWLVSHAALLGDYKRFHRFAWPLLDRVIRASGLADYHELEAEALEPEVRLTRALERAEQRYAALPESERAYSPADARERLTRLCGTVVGMATVSMELAPIERLPSLLPLAPVYPTADLTQLHIDTMRAMVAARYELAGARIAELGKRLQNPDPGLHPTYVKHLQLGVRYMMGLLTAGIAHPATRQLLKELESEPGHRVLAFRVYMIYELALGNLEAAAECQRRAELLNLQDGGQLIFPGSTVASELLVYSYANDLLGVKRVMERMSGLAERFPGWRPFHEIARAQYYRLQGDYNAALTALEPALRETAPGRGQAWTLAAPLHVSLLLALRPPEEAVAVGEGYLEAATRERLSAVQLALQRVVAEALLQAGRIEDAQRMADQHVTGHTSRGSRGVVLGLAYELRARVAIVMKDEAGLRQYAELCASEYKGGHNLTLSAKYQTLMREAEVGGISVSSGLQNAVHPDSLASSHSVTGRSANSRLIACIDTEERALEALQLLLEFSGATHGYLFAVRNGRLELASQARLSPEIIELREVLNVYLRHTLDSGEEITNPDAPVPEPTPLEHWTDASGRRYEPMLLYADRDGESVVTGLAALHYESDARPMLRRDVLEMLADALSEDDRASDIERTIAEAVQED